MTIILNGTTGVTFPNGVTMSDGTSAPVTVAQGGTNSTTAADARTALSAAKSGANSDITSITGLTTPLSAAQGGTGASSLSSITVGTATNATNATTSTNLAGGGAGQIPYQSASGTTAMLAAGTSGYYLQSNGTSAPSWTAVSTTPTTAQVLSATSGASGGAVGTYSFCMSTTNSAVNIGDTISGSSLRYANAQGGSGVGISGTWRCMAYANPWNGGCTPAQASTLFLRIS